MGLALGISKSLYDNLELAEQYAAAAYCPGNTVGSKQSEQLICAKSKNCPKVESAKTSIVIGIKEFV